MDADLQSLVSCRLYMTIIKQRKKDFGEIEKVEKYCQKNFYVNITYNSFVCVFVYVDYICLLLSIRLTKHRQQI